MRHVKISYRYECRVKGVKRVRVVVTMVGRGNVMQSSSLNELREYLPEHAGLYSRLGNTKLRCSCLCCSTTTGDGNNDGRLDGLIHHCRMEK